MPWVWYSAVIAPLSDRTSPVYLDSEGNEVAQSRRWVYDISAFRAGHNLVLSYTHPGYVSGPYTPIDQTRYPNQNLRGTYEGSIATFQYDDGTDPTTIPFTFGAGGAGNVLSRYPESWTRDLEGDGTDSYSLISHWGGGYGMLGQTLIDGSYQPASAEVTYPTSWFSGGGDASDTPPPPFYLALSLRIRQGDKPPAYFDAMETYLAAYRPVVTHNYLVFTPSTPPPGQLFFGAGRPAVRRHTRRVIGGGMIAPR